MKLLMIATSHACRGAQGRGDPGRGDPGRGDPGRGDQNGGSGYPTGLWLEELAVPYYAFLGAGIEVKIASVAGGQVPLDPLSLELRADTPDEVGRFIVDPKAHDMVGSSVKFADIDADSYQALFLPGGYGAMSDLPEDKSLAAILTRFLADARPVAAVGHGAAGLVAAGAAIAGRTLTCFSDAEEASLGLCEYVPFLLESRLREIGALVEVGKEFNEFVRHDGNLVTGQNPASTRLVTETMLRLLG